MKNKIMIFSILMIVLCSFAYATTESDLYDGALHYYKLEETGFNYIDEVGNANLNTGTIPTRTTGKINYGQDFEESSDQQLSTGTDDTHRTPYPVISVWFKTESFHDTQYLAGASDSLGWNLFLYTNGKIGFQVKDAVDNNDRWVTTTATSIGNWFHILAFYDGTDTQICLNGVLDGAQSLNNHDNNISYSGTSKFVIGDIFDDGFYYVDRSYDGIIDEFYLGDFGDTATCTHANFLYNSGSPDSDQQYDFGEGGSPLISASLTYPTNTTTFYGDYNGSIVLSSNINANCQLNDTRWTLQGTQNATSFHFLNNTAIVDQNITFDYSCHDYAGNWSNSTGVWFTKYNALNISVFNAETSTLINQTVSILITNTDTNATQINTTTNGTIVLYEISSGNYSLRFTSTGFTTKTYSVTLGYGLTTNLNAYLENASNSVIFTIRDKDTKTEIEGATVTIKRYVGAELQTVNVLQTDITGRVLFYYVADQYYEFVITKTNYNDKSFVLDPIIFSEYYVEMQKSITITDTSDMAGITIYYTPKTFYEGNNNLTASISSSEGNLAWYWVNISYPGGINNTYGTNAYGESINKNFNITTSTIYDYVNITISYLRTDMSQVKIYNYKHHITLNSTAGTFMGEKDKTYGMGILERILVVVLISIFVGGSIGYYSNMRAGMGIALIIMVLFVIKGFVNIWEMSIPVIVGFIMLAFGGDQ